jgi:hypothetical protein
MNAFKVTAMILIFAGVLALLYGGFSYTEQTHEVKIGTMELSMNETKTVNIPLWAGLSAIGVGALMLVLGSNKK